MNMALRRPGAGDIFPLLALLVLILLGGWLWKTGQLHNGAAPDLHLQEDYGLVSAQGPVSLARLRGKVVLVYFGYTRCASACPTTLLDWRHALDRLSPKEQQQVVGLLVSLDPQRDTPALLAEYTNYFHANIIGVTAEPARLASMAGDFAIYYRRREADGLGGYVFDHTASTFVLDTRGEVRHVLAAGSGAELIRRHIQGLLPSRQG